MDHLYQGSVFNEEDYDFDIINNPKTNPELFNQQLNYTGSLNQNQQKQYEHAEFFEHFESENHLNDQYESMQQYPNYMSTTEQSTYDNENEKCSSSNNYNNSQTNESFPHNQNENEDVQLSSAASAATASTQQPQQQRLPIKMKVQMRKEKIQMVKRMKEGVHPSQQPNQQIEEINNSNQESQSTDIEKMVDENQERESSNNSEVSNKKVSKKISKKKEKEYAKAVPSNVEDDESPQDKRSQQKIKNRMSAQKSRDQKKQQMSDLMAEVNSLTESLLALQTENKELKSRLENNVCSRCLSSPSHSTEESSNDYIDTDDYDPIVRKNKTYFGGYSSSMVMLIAVFCILGLHMQTTGHTNMGNDTSLTSPMIFLQRNAEQQPQQKCTVQEQQNQQYDDLQSRALSLYGIDEKYVQSDSIIDTKLMEGFGKPKLGGMNLMNFQYNKERQNDEIICPNSSVIIHDKDSNEIYNVISVVMNNQTNFYQAHKGQYYPLHQDTQSEQIKLTCLILKYEQISAAQSQL